VSVLFVLLFCLPHKKVTKKVTAIVKFAKTVSLRAKNLNIAIKPLCYIANGIVLFAYFPTSSSIQAIVSFFYALLFTVF